MSPALKWICLDKSVTRQFRSDWLIFVRITVKIV
jgi:hypothetical protein